MIPHAILTPFCKGKRLDFFHSQLIESYTVKSAGVDSQILVNRTNALVQKFMNQVYKVRDILAAPFLRKIVVENCSGTLLSSFASKCITKNV